ncbi:MAG TPA: ABC transporter permease [Burkholderiaceae bacterium]
MKTAALAWHYLWARPLVAALNVLLLALALASVTLVLLVGTQIDRAFGRDVAGIDVVVGAKGSPMQLILSGVFHLDVPTGNVPLAEVQRLQRHPQVETLIPLALGDSFRGFRIVGTTPDYIAHYAVPMVQGRAWAAPMEAVLGADVAQRAGGAQALRPGDRFTGSHGLAGGHDHGDAPYTVAGVLAPCGCVLDRLVLTDLASVWQVHEGPDDSTLGAEDRAALAAEREVTVALIRYHTPLAAVSFPRFVNTTTRMQAAAPAVEITRLLRMVGVGTDVLRAFGVVLLAIAGLSVFIALWHAVRERRSDLALLRMLGAPPSRLAGLLLCEALWLALLASVLGLLGGHLLTALLGWMLPPDNTLPLRGTVVLASEWAVPLAAALVAGLAAVLPALQALRVEVDELLQPG